MNKGTARNTQGTIQAKPKLAVTSSRLTKYARMLPITKTKSSPTSQTAGDFTVKVASLRNS